MSLIHRHRQPTTETPEQTLARLRDAVPTGGPVPDQHLDQRFTVARKKGMGYNIAEVDAFIDTIGERTADEIRNVVFTTQGRRNRGYDEDEVDRFLDEQLAQVDTATSTSEPTDPTLHTPADPTQATTPEVRGTLGRIPQRRWRRICISFWACLLLSSATVAVGDAFWLVAALFLAPFVFWGVGAERTGQIDPSEWTETQRVSKWMWDHMPEGV